MRCARIISRDWDPTPPRSRWATATCKAPFVGKPAVFVGRGRHLHVHFVSLVLLFAQRRDHRFEEERRVTPVPQLHGLALLAVAVLWSTYAPAIKLFYTIPGESFGHHALLWQA